MLNKYQKKIFNWFVALFKQQLFTSHIDDMFLVIENLKKRGYEPKFILDVGAYEGHWTLQVRKIFTNSRYLMFEAQHNKKSFLEKIKNTHPNVEYFIGLLGSKVASDVEFYFMETGSSVLYENTNHNRTVEKLNMNTLDNLLVNEKIEASCFLKIDVQGFELEVLSGAKHLLPNVDLVLLETSVLQYNEGSPLIHDVIRFMEELDFVIYDICSPKRTSKEHALFQVDIFFVKKESPLRKIDKF
jgi:FkbM family methyltransferase